MVLPNIAELLNSLRQQALVVTPPPPPGPANVRHSKENPDWQTPQEDIDCARIALGGKIDLDVFSCASANARVGATQWFGPDHPDSERRDSFNAPWIAESIFENHPGLTTARSWKKTCDEFAAGHFQRLVWLGFTVEQSCTLSDLHLELDGTVPPREVRWSRNQFVPTDFSLCFLRKRIAFIDARNPDRRSAPAHANFIIGLGTDPATFERAYAHRGQCIHGELTRALQKVG